VRRRDVDRESYDPTGLIPVHEALGLERGQLVVTRGHLNDDVVGHSCQLVLGNGNGESREDGPNSGLGR